MLTTRWGSLLLLIVAGALGCTRNIAADSSSGKDFRWKGATKIELTDNEGRAKGVVTYPGGDRVDWKYFEIPAGSKGRARIRLKHTPPRPNLDVAFNVYDPYFELVGRAKPSSRGKRAKSASVDKIEPGKYYLQIYAPRRIDAGSYRVEVRFYPRKEVNPVDLTALADQIPEPPELPAVPEPVVDPTTPPPAGGGTTTTTTTTGPPLPPTPPPPQAVFARISNVKSAVDGGTVITFNKGKDQGVDRGWKGTLLRGGKDGAPLAGSEFTVVRVTSRESVAKIKLPLDQVNANPWVKVEP